VASPAKDYSQTAIRSLTDETDFEAWLRMLYEPLEHRGLAEMAAEGHDPEAVLLTHMLDCRYLGQSYELSVPHKPADNAHSIVSAFHAAHEGRYGYARQEAIVELVTLRLTAVAPTTLPHLPRRSGAATTITTADHALVGEKVVWFGDRFEPTKLYERGRLEPGNRFHGPAVVFQYDTTTVLPPGWEAVVDRRSNFILTRIAATDKERISG
jgi:N-methylhydantoinase A